MKLDKHPVASMTGRLSPADALWQIRRETRPGVMRVQKKWRRRAMLRRWALRVERWFLWGIGTLGVIFTVMAVVSFLGVVYQGMFR